MSFTRKKFLKTLGLGLGASSLGKATDFPLQMWHPLIKANELQTGNTFGLISPASSLSGENKYAEIAENIEQMGFKVKIGRHTKDNYGYFAGTDKARADDLNAIF